MPVITVRVTTRTPSQAGEPVLYRLGKDFPVVTNIRRAQVTPEYGFAEVDIEGPLDAVHRAVAWLETTGLDVSTVQRSVSDRSNL